MDYFSHLDRSNGNSIPPLDGREFYEQLVRDARREEAEKALRELVTFFRMMIESSREVYTIARRCGYPDDHAQQIALGFVMRCILPPEPEEATRA